MDELAKQQCGQLDDPHGQLEKLAQTNLQKVGLTLQDVGLGLWGGSAVSTFSSYAQDLQSGGEQVASSIEGGIAGGVQAVGNALQSLLNNPSVQAFVNSIISQIMPVLNNAKQQISSIIAQATTGLQGWNTFYQNAQNTYNQDLASAESACNNAINGAQATFNAAKAQATSIIQTLQQDLNNLSSQGVLANMKNEVASLVSQARQDATSNLAAWLADSALQRPANMVQAAESDMQSFVQNWLKVNFSQVSW